MGLKDQYQTPRQINSMCNKWKEVAARLLGSVTGRGIWGSKMTAGHIVSASSPHRKRELNIRTTRQNQMYSTSQVPQRRHESSRRDLYTVSGFHTGPWGWEEYKRIIDQSRNFPKELTERGKHKEWRDLRGFFIEKLQRVHTRDTMVPLKPRAVMQPIKEHWKNVSI